MSQRPEQRYELHNIEDMPNSYPPASVQRHHDRENRRSNSGSRNRRDGNNRDVRNQPFQGYQEEPTRWKKLRQHGIAMAGEFVGTTTFLWFAFAGTQAAGQTSTEMNTQRLVFICLSFGFSLLVTVWAHYRVSGGLFNPAVTLALVLTKNMPWFRGVLLLPAQILGGIVAAALVQCMLPGPIAVVTSLSNGTSPAQGVFIEAFGTALLVFTILMLAAEKHETTPFAPLGIGLALFVAELGTVLYTGGGVNPARAFGPSVVDTHFPHYHYIYWFGPIIGSLMATGYYAFLKSFGYEDANPGQDSKGQ